MSETWPRAPKFYGFERKSPGQPGSEVLSVLSLKTRGGDPGPAWVRGPHLNQCGGPSSTAAGLPGEEQLGATESLTASGPGRQPGLQR